MPMKRELYPDDWVTIALNIKESVNWKCEACRKQCCRPGEDVKTRADVLTVAHLDHDPANSVRSNLVALCAGCHLRYDAATRRGRKADNWRELCRGDPTGERQTDFFLNAGGESG